MISLYYCVGWTPKFSCPVVELLTCLIFGWFQTIFASFSSPECKACVQGSHLFSVDTDVSWSGGSPKSFPLQPIHFWATPIGPVTAPEERDSLRSRSKEGNRPRESPGFRHGGTRIVGWFLLGNIPIKKWMITRGTIDWWNPQTAGFHDRKWWLDGILTMILRDCTNSIYVCEMVSQAQFS